jgi:hypothetical protein
VSYKLTRKAKADLAALIDWIYYDRIAGELCVLRIYHGAREPL